MGGNVKGAVASLRMEGYTLLETVKESVSDIWIEP